VSGAPTHLYYDFGGQKEYCLSFGDVEASRCILIIPPLFDEMNRVRRTLVQAMRALAEHGLRTLLPDLPGCNESAADLPVQTIETWQEAVAALALQLGATHIAALRGGALIDHKTSLPVWRLAPVKGRSLLKTMLRTRIAAEREAGRTVSIEQLMAAAQSSPLELSGYVLGMAMLESLDSVLPAVVPDLHEAALTDVNGSALWLRAEPQDDPAMSAALAANLDRWSASCGG
jgi:pimeloyl-ACP methyl ester carboxylesterase